MREITDEIFEKHCEIAREAFDPDSVMTPVVTVYGPETVVPIFLDFANDAAKHYSVMQAKVIATLFNATACVFVSEAWRTKMGDDGERDESTREEIIAVLAYDIDGTVRTRDYIIVRGDGPVKLVPARDRGDVERVGGVMSEFLPEPGWPRTMEERWVFEKTKLHALAQGLPVEIDGPSEG
jgi:hypothetical protein